MRVQDKVYLPWKVYTGELRPRMSVKVIEIHDALGRVIVHWSGFDACEFSVRDSLRNARRMVRTVNGER